MPHLLVFQHVAVEPLGTLDALIRARGHRIRFHNFERHPDAEPDVDRYRGLIVLGGPMNVEDQYRRPHLKAELLAIAGAAPGSAVVVAVPDARAGSKLVLVHENVTATALWERVLEQYHVGCPGYRRITALLGIQSIPKSGLGKPQRAALSRFAQERAI